MTVKNKSALKKRCSFFFLFPFIDSNMIQNVLIIHIKPNLVIQIFCRSFISIVVSMIS